MQPAQASTTSTAMASDSCDLLRMGDEDDQLLGPGEPFVSARAPAPRPPASPSRALTTSPPPHIVGRLVEMGYGPMEARQALAKTPSGQDVDGALAHLQATTPEPAPRTERAPVPRLSREPPLRTAPSHTPSPTLHQHADQLYTQASELGTTMLKNANAWWGSAKAQAQKALDEVSKEPNSRGSTVAVATGLGRHMLRRWGGQAKAPLDYDARPRWMDEATAALPARKDVSPASSAPPPPEVSLLEGDSTQPVPALPKPERTPVVSALPSALPPASSPAVRTVTPDDTGVVAHAMRLKEVGNRHYVQGAYADAEVHYTQALDMLPCTSLWRVPLLNNRANVRLKNGDGEGTISDCALCLSLIVLPSMPDGLYRASVDALPSSHASLNLREAYAKSLNQRARAYEALEKYALARKDWAQLLLYERLEGSGVKSGEMHRRAASEGTARCDRMLRPAAPRQAPATPAVVAPTSQQGVTRMRALRAAQDAEEEQRLQHKDSVDARIAAWTKGKETNVRALLSSVDDPQYGLVWPALRWKKVGLHELLSEAQVKRAYTKAIARLHPDKLSSSESSVEQRMLAAGMFHALNAAFHS
ncbi:auxilin-like clathrin-binding protein required for normal clathrin function [Malassezia nana]|uniref:Auxilin-like clathrin-binding protein required for normal clathrin function n=1 Tax=Malassezia nana TaxID=180528 RepID=A0AAF0J3L1_9BASI|nr:auxilin-like clathrin-binding protein required for normal clathrin function [Malassezia nana]